MNSVVSRQFVYAYRLNDRNISSGKRIPPYTSQILGTPGILRSMQLFVWKFIFPFTFRTLRCFYSSRKWNPTGIKIGRSRRIRERFVRGCSKRMAEDFCFLEQLGRRSGDCSPRGRIFTGEKWLIFRLDSQQVSRVLLVLPNIVRNRKSFVGFPPCCRSDSLAAY